MPISRMFNTADDAMGAVRDLKSAGFKASGIHVVDKAPGYVSMDALKKKGVLAADAQKHSKELSEGKTLVLVSAPFGTAAKATEILERPRSGDSGRPQAKHEGAIWNEKHPISSALKMPLLSKHPAPLSSMLGMPTLSKKRPSVKLSKKRSSTKLITNPAPLSSKLKLPLLSKAKSKKRP